MPKKIKLITKADLINVSLPEHKPSYTVISHEFVIEHCRKALTEKGFIIMSEEYRATSDGQIAQGIYKLHFNTDPELSMMLAWTNSYNKQVKFKCVVGACINNTGASMILGDINTWIRKHTGKADIESSNIINNYIDNAYSYYNQLCSDKASMEGININLRKQSQLLGVLFAEYDILSIDQASLVKRLMTTANPIFPNPDTLWTFYNYITVALQNSHPKTWMEDQRLLHYFITIIANFTKIEVEIVPLEPEVIIVDKLLSNYGQPENQVNQIAELTNDPTVLEPTIPKNETLSLTPTIEDIELFNEELFNEELYYGNTVDAKDADLSMPQTLTNNTDFDLSDSDLDSDLAVDFF